MNAYQHGSAWAASQIHLWLTGDHELPPQFAPLWQWCLAHNLAIAAFGQRMFELGSEYRMRAMLGLPDSEDWTPGCGKQAE